MVCILAFGNDLERKTNFKFPAIKFILSDWVS